MGQGESTPLSLMTDHFSDVRARAHNLSLLVKKSKLITFCSSEWPAFQVGWPPEGTFQPSIIQAVKKRVMAPDPRGHPDQVLYVMVWQDLVENPPKWLKPLVHKLPSSSNSQVLVMETPLEETKKERGPKTSPSGIILSKPDRFRNRDKASAVCPPIAIPSKGRNSPGRIKRVERARGS